MTQLPWYKSKSIWLGFIAVVAGVGTLFGLEISQEDQEGFAEAAVAIGTAIGGIASAFYGYQKRKAG
ncbi:hypothetical protein [Mariniflexile sp.]|uniref:hypothetical protein n=1 Tax=Shewanella sp. TaxID=50422 RepID=UPI004048B98A